MTMFAALFAMNMLASNVRFKVTNMRCGNCAKRVENVLKGNDAVKKVNVDLENKSVCVRYDKKKATAEDLLKLMTEAKFQTEIVKKCDKKNGFKASKITTEHKKCQNDCGADGCGDKE